MKIKSLIIILLVGLSACTPLTQGGYSDGGYGKTLQYRDLAYESQIKTVVLHPGQRQPEATLLPAVAKLGEGSLVLGFDDLRPDRDTYYAKIFHCNYDWTRSNLNDLDFMTEYNEFPITNYEFSVDTHIPYVHYWLTLPRVKHPGNYVVAVYRGSNKEDIILSKRFMIYDQRVSFANERNLIGAGSVAALNQQINFTISYRNLDILNPLDMVNVSIRQNQRWDNLATNIKPSFVREIEKQLEYRFFDSEKMFKGGNEFRFFDMRSLTSPGRNVARVTKTVKPYEIYLERDKTRQYQAYAQYQDINGGFILDNYDYRSASFSNYANVHFSLASPPIDGKVYVAGGFNYWNLNRESEMQYDSAQKIYEASVLLKQGWYDYQYVLRSKTQPPYLLEGSHFETENQYEIFIYYRSLQPNADLLVGYIRLDKNQR
jgi:hypothetical protein